MLDYESYYRENQSYFSQADMDDFYWYEGYRGYNSNESRFFVFNAVLSFGYNRALVVNNIERTEYGYKVRCKESTSNNSPDEKIPTLEWSAIQGQEEFDLFICIDGDYIDLYAINTENRVGTFVSVSDEFVNQFNNLIKTNTCDLANRVVRKLQFLNKSNVQWPHRAGVNMDLLLASIPIAPKEDKQSEPVIEFSIDSADTEVQQNEISQNGAKTSAMPLWAWVTIIGGAVAVAGGAAVFVIKRKKK